MSTTTPHEEAHTPTPPAMLTDAARLPTDANSHADTQTPTNGVRSPQNGTQRLRVGDIVRANGRTGTVTYVQYVAGPIPLAVTVCTGPSAFDLIHPKPESVVAA